MSEKEKKREIERKEKKIMREWKRKLQKKRNKKKEEEEKKKEEKEIEEEKGGERDRRRVCTHARRQRDVLIVRCVHTVYRHSDRNIITLIDSERKAVYV